MRIFQLSLQLAELILLLKELGESYQQLLVLALDFIEGIGDGTVGQLVRYVSNAVRIHPAS
jgi:hypothetical protein